MQANSMFYLLVNIKRIKVLQDGIVREKKDWQTYISKQGIKARRTLILGVALGKGKLVELYSY
jgi:hypothetical protein